MKDEYTVVCVADPHIGKNNVAGHPVSAGRWDAPIEEVIAYCEDHKNEVDWAIIAGDLGHDRRPTTENARWATQIVIRLGQITDVIAVDGNHDSSPNGIPTSWVIDELDVKYGLMERASRSVSLYGASEFDEGAQVIAVPYPFMQAIGHIDARLKAAKELTLAQIEHARSKADPDRPLMLVGHLMVSRGGTAMQGEPMMLGRDVVFPLEELREIMHPWPIVLGHVHQHDDVYVGSTQPTDFADTGQKGFVVVKFERPETHWRWTKEFVPYKTSVTVGSIDVRVIESEYQVRSEIIGDFHLPTDLGRIRVHVPAGIEAPTEATIREKFADRFKNLVEVDIRKERVRVARMDIADDEIAGLSVQDWCDAWLGQSDYPDDVRKAARAAIAGAEGS